LNFESSWLVIYKDDLTLSPTTQMVYMQPLIRLFCCVLIMCKLSCTSFEDWTSHTSRRQFTNYSYSMSHAQGLASNRVWQIFPQRQPFCQDTEDFIARIQKVEQGTKPAQDTPRFEKTIYMFSYVAVVFFGGSFQQTSKTDDRTSCGRVPLPKNLDQSWAIWCSCLNPCQE